MKKMFRRNGAKPSPGASPSSSSASTPTLADKDLSEAEDHAQDKFYELGVASDCNRRYRKTMEDAHHYELDYMGIPGCAYFGVFDGHAGPQCARYCADTLHTTLAASLKRRGKRVDIAEALAEAFNETDHHAEAHGIKNSGCTAVVALSCAVLPSDTDDGLHQIVPAGSAGSTRRLFVANVGDARAVLYHASASETRRLSYDHRGSDIHEQKRITNAGGILMGNRVNGVLAVTRSLGDLYMKEFVVGDPYTTETDVGDGDVLVLACDGLWDVCADDQAVSIARDASGALAGSQALLSHALTSFTADNVTVMAVRVL